MLSQPRPQMTQEAMTEPLLRLGLTPQAKVFLTIHSGSSFLHQAVTEVALMMVSVELGQSLPLIQFWKWQSLFSKIQSMSFSTVMCHTSRLSWSAPLLRGSFSPGTCSDPQTAMSIALILTGCNTACAHNFQRVALDLEKVLGREEVGISEWEHPGWHSLVY